MRQIITASKCIKTSQQVLLSKRRYIQAKSSVKHSFYSNHVLEDYAMKSTNLVTLRQLVVFGRNLNQDKLLKSANYVRTELPIRLAHRIRDFQNLPFIVGTNPHIEAIYELYWDAFEAFRAVPVIQNVDENRMFCELLQSMLKTHLVVIPKLATGISETAKHMAPAEADRFLNEMIRSRIGRRVLAQQHMSLSNIFEQNIHPPEGSVGIVDTRCNAVESVEQCVELAGKQIRETYGVEPPAVVMDGHRHATFTYIPSHLQYILYELLKNSMQHTVSHHLALHDHQGRVRGDRFPSMAEEALAQAHSIYNSTSEIQSHLIQPALPFIRVTMGEGENEVMFRISDQGGGIDKDIMKNVWSFWHLSERADSTSKSSPRLGTGLCLAKAYANYWGGSISIQSMDGYGTDAYVKVSTGNEHEHISVDKDLT